MGLSLAGAGGILPSGRVCCCAALFPIPQQEAYPPHLAGNAPPHLPIGLSKRAPTPSPLPQGLAGDHSFSLLLFSCCCSIPAAAAAAAASCCSPASAASLRPLLASSHGPGRGLGGWRRKPEPWKGGGVEVDRLTHHPHSLTHPHLNEEGASSRWDARPELAPPGSLPQEQVGTMGWVIPLH